MKRLRSDSVPGVKWSACGANAFLNSDCTALKNGLGRVALDSGTPVGFGILTCDTLEQALDRAGGPGASEDKGRESAAAAVQTWAVLQDL